MGNKIINFIKGVGENCFDSIEIIGNKKIIVDNVGNILEYNESEIRLSIGKKILAIAGNKLALDNYNENSIVICGDLNEIKFE